MKVIPFCRLRARAFVAQSTLSVWMAVVLFQGFPAVIAQESAHGTGNRPVAEAYRLQVGDEVTVSVFEEGALGGRFVIDLGGKIRLPLLGEVAVAGATVRECEALLEAEYTSQRYLRNPQVTVTIDSYTAALVTILGEVRRPGVIRLPLQATSLDIVELIARAGDFTDIANRERVVVKRTPADGSPEREFEVNVKALLEASGRNQPARFEVLPGDTVFVRRSFL